MRTHLRTRATAVLLCVVLLSANCTIGKLTITPTRAINLSVAVELTLRDVQNETRRLCNPAVVRPNPILGECVPTSVAIGFTTARFRMVSGILARCFDFIHDVLAPALDRYKEGDPTPPEFVQFTLLTKDVFDFLGGLTQTPQLQALFALGSTLATSLASLAKMVGAATPEYVLTFIQEHP